MTEIIFEVTEDEVDGGYSASAFGHGIHSRATRSRKSAGTSRRPSTATSTTPCRDRS